MSFIRESVLTAIMYKKRDRISLYVAKDRISSYVAKDRISDIEPARL